MAFFHSLIGFACINVAWVWYLALIPRERVPQRPIQQSILMLVGVLIGAFGVVGALATSFGIVASIILFGLDLFLAGFFFYLLRLATLPDGKLAVRVGDQLIDFALKDDRGFERSLSEWSGQRVLLKFFRGHW